MPEQRRNPVNSMNSLSEAYQLTQSNSVSTSRAAPGSPDLWKPGDVLFGRMEVIDRIGSGGMGSVYRVLHWDWGLELAVKVPHHRLVDDPQNRERWILEAHTWVELGVHPNIVRCWFVREWEGVPLLFLDYVTGGTLKDLIQSTDYPLEDWGTALHLAIDACEGLGYAHTFGLTHRDVKPANLLLAPDGRLLVTDFGLVKQGDGAPGNGGTTGSMKNSPGLTQTSCLLGTPAYAAPEQWSQGQVDAAADIYALGVVFYELCCGRLPFLPGGGPEGLALLLQGHLYEEPPDPRDFAPAMPDSLRLAILACLAKQPAERPANAAQLRESLCSAYQEATGKPFPRRQAKAGPQRADALNNKAVSLFYIGKPRDAMVAWSRAAELDALHPESVFNRSLLQWRQGQITTEEVLSRLARVRSEHPRVGAYVGQFHLEQYAPQLAESELKQALQMAEVSEDGPSWRNLGDALMCQGRAEEAEEAYARAMLLSPGDRESETRLAQARSRQRTLGERISFPLNRPIHSWEQISPVRSLALGEGHLLLQTELGLECWSVPNFTLRWSAEAAPGELLLGAGYCLLGKTCTSLETGEVNRLEGDLRYMAVVRGDSDSAICAEGAALRLVELPSGKRVRSLVGHDGPVKVVAAAGQVAISGGVDRTVMAWDLNSGGVLTEFRAHRDHINALAVTPDGAVAISGCQGGRVMLWVARTGQRLASWEHEGQVTSLETTCRGRFALANFDTPSGPSYSVFDLATRERLMDRPGRATGLGEPRYLLVCEPGFQVLLRELPSGRFVRSFSSFSEPVGSLSVSPQGRWAAWKVGKNVQVWEADEDSRLVERSLLVSRIRDIHETEEARKHYQEHLKAARAAFQEGELTTAYQQVQQARSVPGYDRDPEALKLSADLLGKLPRTRLRSAWQLQAFQEPTGEPAGDLVLAGEADLAFSAAGRFVRLWNPRTATCIRGFTGHKRQVNCLSLSPNQLVTGSQDGTARLWDPTSGSCQAVVVAGEGSVEAVNFLDGTLIIGNSSGTASQWSKGERLDTVQLPAGSHRWYSPKSATALVQHNDTVWLQSLSSNSKRRKLPLRGQILAAAWAFRGAESAVVVATDGGELQLWDLRKRRKLAETAVAGQVRRIVLAGDCALTLATGDREAHLWNIQPLEHLGSVEHPCPIACAALTRSGRYLLTAGEDGSYRLWELDWELAAMTEPSRPPLWKRVAGALGLAR